MKGIVLAGGSGTRLHPVTKAVNKHLLPVYDKPMIFYPISILKDAGITDILMIVRREDYPQYLSVLHMGADFGLNIQYEFQDEPKGIADAFNVASEWIGDDPVALILGDNIFYGSQMSDVLYEGMDSAKRGEASIFACIVSDPKRYGVIRFEPDGVSPQRIVEKPAYYVSDWAVSGLYCYPSGVSDMARHLKPSARGELEITDLNNLYLEMGEMEVVYLESSVSWLDTGTHDSLIEASMYVKTVQDRTGKKIGDIYER